MTPKDFAQSKIDELICFGKGDPDWSLFVRSLKFSLLAILARIQREGSFNKKIYQGRICTIKRSSLSLPLFSAQHLLSCWQRRKIQRLNRQGKRILYSRKGDRFAPLYTNHLDKNDFCYIVDHYTAQGYKPFFVPVPQHSSDYKQCQVLYGTLSRSLRLLGVHLDADEESRLNQEAYLSVLSLKRAQRFFSQYTVDALVLDGDSWLPVSMFAGKARQMKKTVVCIQHGLDAEHWCLDEASSRYHCVWGPARKKSYQDRSGYIPEEIFVTGNPLYDKYGFPESTGPGGKRWLLLTRPHSVNKCYEPSRYPEEGKDVLLAIIDQLQNFPEVSLTIRPHPKDNIQEYVKVIEKKKLKNRISISLHKATLMDQLHKADVVFSEDSTSAIEAMILGKPLVHVSACKDGPCMPFVDYNAAFSGLGASQLHDAVNRLTFGLSPKERMQLNVGQKAFLRDYAGDLDGRASKRMAAVIRSVV